MDGAEHKEHLGREVAITTVAVSNQQYRQHYKGDSPVYDRDILYSLHLQLRQHAQRISIPTITGDLNIYDGLDQFTTQNHHHEGDALLIPDQDEIRRRHADEQVIVGSHERTPLMLARDGVLRKAYWAPEYTCVQTLINPARSQSDPQAVPGGSLYPIRVKAILDCGSPGRAPTAIYAEIASQHFEELRSRWEESDMCHALSHHLRSAKFRRIDKIIALGLGSMGTGDGAYFSEAMAQHHAIATMKTIIEQRQSDGQVTVFCQDPSYRENDRVVLSRLGYHTVDDPQGFLEIDGSSLVFSVANGTCIKQITADMPRPAAILWERVDSTLEGEIESTGAISLDQTRPEDASRTGFFVVDDEVVPGLGNDPSSRRVRQMLAEYDDLELHEGDEFGWVALYLRRCERPMA